MYTVYVLHSTTYEKIYIGYTSDLRKRMLSHNHLSHKGWTRKYRPWRLIHQEEYDSKRSAMQRERELKGAKGREWIRLTLLT